MKTHRPIVITGFMGCGKTEVARGLARRLDLVVVDLDEKIAERKRKTAAQLIVEEGEPAFREIETNTLRELLDSGDAGVIALGGGAWITEANRSLVSQHQGVSIWLDTPFEVCWQRIEISTEDRPLGRTREQAQELFNFRRPFYELAAIHLPLTDQESLEAVLDRTELALTQHMIDAS
jgi:shikimate kinase